MAENCMNDPGMLLWVDDNGCDIWNSLKKYGYSMRSLWPIDQDIYNICS